MAGSLQILQERTSSPNSSCKNGLNSKMKRGPGESTPGDWERGRESWKRDRVCGSLVPWTTCLWLHSWGKSGHLCGLVSSLELARYAGDQCWRQYRHHSIQPSLAAITNSVTISRSQTWICVEIWTITPRDAEKSKATTQQRGNATQHNSLESYFQSQIVWPYQESNVNEINLCRNLNNHCKRCRERQGNNTTER